MSEGIVMLGVIHRDASCSARLAGALEEWSPVLVSVEVSPFALSFRKRTGPALLEILAENLPRAARRAKLGPEAAASHAAVEWLRAYLRTPAEWETAWDWAGQRALPCCPVDISSLSRRYLSKAREMVGVDNLALLLEGEPPRGTGVERARAQRLLAGEAGILPPPPLQAGREEILARRVRRLARAAARRGGIMAHVGGWEHLLPDRSPRTLADRLEVPSGRRILI